MRIVTYSTEYFDLVHDFARKITGNLSLRSRAFVDHYYGNGERCKLFIAFSEDDRVVATLGVEEMRFVHNSRPMIIGLGSNFFSLEPGAGGVLFMHWLRSYPVAMVCGGSPDTHRILRRMGWRYYHGVKSYYFNRPILTYPHDSFWRAAGKWAARKGLAVVAKSVRTQELRSDVLSRVEVREERTYTEGLIPRRSPFPFRFTPTAEHLAWRYSTTLTFVWYRLFRILDDGVSVGYVILREEPNGVVVAQCDAEDEQTLAYGVLLSVAAVRSSKRNLYWVGLSSCHTGLNEIFEFCGFKASGLERPLALGSAGGKVDLPRDTATWLINHDWGDEGLIATLREQPRGGESPS